ncbi:MAG: 4-hydroxy-tetrahydrodipicolinate synthase [Ruminococcus bromii]|nr:4-hydroxy-tetrahydrodipicolinate synthase [Ruminococcus bromii]
MKEVIFTGAGVALVTPFHPDGTVNYDELERLIEFQIENGTDAIVTCGTTGEAATLSGEEHTKVINFTVKKVRGRIPVIAGTGSNDTQFAVELSKEAKALGVDGLLLVTPYYNKTSQRGLIASFNHIANSVKMPCILYNVPSRTGVNILPETYGELAKNPYIVATKEANYDISALAKTMHYCGDNLTVYCGEDVQTLAIVAMGGKGVISVLSNVLPREMHELTAAALENRMDDARARTLQYVELMNALFMDVNPIPVKAALNMMGFNCGHCRLPLTDMSEAQLESLRAVLSKYVKLA